MLQYSCLPYLQAAFPIEDDIKRGMWCFHLIFPLCKLCCFDVKSTRNACPCGCPVFADPTLQRAMMSLWIAYFGSTQYRWRDTQGTDPVMTLECEAFLMFPYRSILKWGAPSAPRERGFVVLGRGLDAPVYGSLLHESGRGRIYAETGR